MLIGSAQFALAADPGADYVNRIRPLVAIYCLDCHSTIAKKGGLDLQRFGTLEQVRVDIEPWQAVVEMLETDEMPPNGKPRPRPADRRSMISWIRDLLEREARLRAGDPGPVLIRRLNNAEYTYTIRDLTDVDLQPTREFPADGAAGEGFLNATDSLSISPDLMTKYLGAAKATAAHAVLLPDGFRYSKSKFKEDWVNEVLVEIRNLHARYATGIGEIPLAEYLKATVAHGDAIRSGKTSFAQVAMMEKLSAKYLEILWQLMSDDRPSILLQRVQSRWRNWTSGQPELLSEMLEDILTLQGVVWRKQEPLGEHTLDDRYVAASANLTGSHTFKLDIPRKPGETVVFYLAAQVINGAGDQARVILRSPRFESGTGPAVLLRDALQTAQNEAPEKLPAPANRVSRLDVSRFDEDRLVMEGTEVLEVRLPGPMFAGRTFVVEARLDSDGAPTVLVRFDVRLTPGLPQVDRGLAWEYRAGPSGPPLLVVQADDAVREQVAASAEEFRRVFPARVCYPGVIVRDTTVTLERFHRGDRFLSRLLLDEKEHKRLDRLWHQLHYISGDALQVRDSLATLVKGEIAAYQRVAEVVHRRAKETERDWQASEPIHLDALLDFAARAYRRPLTAREQRSHHDLYRSLRENELTHDEAFRAVLTRVLVSPNFLYRIERPAAAAVPTRVSDWELATRLSYFLWSSMPGEELRQLAADGRLHDPQVLTAQTRRMLQDPRIRALAIEFGAQWLEVRGFDQFQGKNQELFPTFDAKLREAIYEESILFFQDMFQADRPLRKLIDADHTFVNETLAVHYGIGGVKGEQFRRVDGVQDYGRGGLLGQASVLSKHSGASRTSPVLRGNWIAEILLGQRLPRPPDDVPMLPEGEAGGDLTVRQLVEKHAKLPQCAVCHQRIDPLGFALERYDTIGRHRDKDLAGRPVDANARLSDGTQFEGIDGLRQYLLKERKQDFVRQFCRKLLGYALGRRVILSDRKLLDVMAAEVEKDDSRMSDVMLAVIRSRQFQFIRGSGKER